MKSILALIVLFFVIKEEASTRGVENVLTLNLRIRLLLLFSEPNKEATKIRHDD